MIVKNHPLKAVTLPAHKHPQPAGTSGFPVSGTFDSPLGGGTFTAQITFNGPFPPAPVPVPPPNPVPVPVPTPTPTPTPTPAPSGGIAWPSFTGTAQLVGTSAKGVSVYVDPTLGQQGTDNAKALLADADRVVGINTTLFGANAAGPVNVIVFALGGATDGTGGADHMACDFVNGGNIEVDASFGSPARVSALFEAELSECAMNNNLCGLSTGESLSRWCAMATGQGTNPLADFSTAPTWVQDGMADWVSKVNPTDQDADSIGCGMAFISWLISTGHSLPDIAQVMVQGGDAETLSGTYAVLTGQPATGAWAAFEAAVNALPGGAAGITSDDPWGSLAAATTQV